MEVLTETDLKCYHCGQLCNDITWLEKKSFCCYGCKTVYEILSANNLCRYYDFEKTPGTVQPEINDNAFTYLDDSEVRRKVIEFDSAEFAKVNFYIPVIHCVSCIWLLENLHKLEP